MDRSSFIRGLLDDQSSPQLPQSVPQNDFGPRAYGLLNALFPDPYEAAGEAVQQFRAGNPLDAFATMYGAMPATGALKNVSKAAKAAETVSEAAPQGIIAYHGSPHSFDRFDMSKIGTGEGAQAYGHGLYFAENEGVARSYREGLTNKNIPAGAGIDKTAFSVVRNAPTLDDATLAPFVQKAWPNASEDEIASAIARAKGNLQPGSMYQVRINADPEHFLDWDKPFSSADDVERFAAKFDSVDPAIRKRIEDWGYTRQQSGQPMPDGNDIMREIFGGVEGPKGRAATSALREAGIPGIKYLDQGSRPNVGHVDMLRQQLATLKSRSASQAAIDNTQRALDEAEKSISRNYVVFDDNLVEILKKYGLIGLLGGGAAMSASQSPNAQQSAPLL